MEDELALPNLPESLADALTRVVPDVVTRTLEYATHLHTIQSSLYIILANADVEDNIFLYDGSGIETPGMRGLRGLRQQLVTIMITHSALMGDARLAQTNNGWTLLMATWCVVAHVAVIIDRVRALDVEQSHVEDEFGVLERNELLTTCGGLDDIADMSLSELQFAIDVLRDRTPMLDGVNGILLRYVLLLELRAAQFMCGCVSIEEYDVELWVRPNTCIVTPAFIASMAWYFVRLKQHLHQYLNVSASSFFATELNSGLVRLVTYGTPLRDRKAVISALDAHSQRLHQQDHEKQFRKYATKYMTSPGDIEAHSYVYGMCGIEVSTYRDVIDTRRTADAVAYIATRKFQRPVPEWWRAGRRRAELTVGRAVGGGATCEAIFEEYCVLYIIGALFMAKHQVPWLKWFFVRDTATNYELRIRRGIVIGLPFLVQRLGRCACVVPAIPETSVPRAKIEEMAGLPITKEGNIGCVMYDAANVLDAFTIWVRFMHDGWHGRIHHAHEKRLKPLLATLLQ